MTSEPSDARVGPIFTIPGCLFSELAHCYGYHAEEILCPQNHLGTVKQRQLAEKVGRAKASQLCLVHPARSHLEQWGKRSRPVSWIHF